MKKRWLAGLLALVLPIAALASVTVNVNGTNYTIPQTNEKGWGNSVTSWIQGISANTLQPSGGTFSLTADIDFGASFGLISSYYKSRSANVSTAGPFRLANGDFIGWRNVGNSANLLLGPSGTGNGFLSYNSVDLVGTSLTQTLTNKTIAFGSNTFTGALPPANGGSGIVNAGTFTWGSNNITVTTSGTTGVTLPTAGTLATLAGTENLTNKTVTAGIVASYHDVEKVVTPGNPSSSYLRVYAKSDNKLYTLNSGGTETQVGSGGGGIAIQWIEDVSSAVPTFLGNQRLYAFSAGLSHALYGAFQVPSSYAAGTQINLKAVEIFNNTSGNSLMQTVSTLVRTGTDLITSTTNQRTSTNSAITVTVANTPFAVTFDLTDSTGKINGVTVSPGDTVELKLSRGSDTATNEVWMPIYSEVTFP